VSSFSVVVMEDLAALVVAISHHNPALTGLGGWYQAAIGFTTAPPAAGAPQRYGANR
jgi:hypothetical protein